MSSAGHAPLPRSIESGLTAPEAWPRAALPAPLTSFVGRDAELVAAAGALHTTRLLTLTGAGGSGKTRLALELARRESASVADGVAWVELASVSDASLLPMHLATALSLTPDAPSSALEAIRSALRERDVLLVLDNCEHLVAAVAELASQLLRDAPRLRLLATSREALGIAGERAWLVPPLALPAAASSPSPEELREAAAVRLFLERARDALATFELTPDNAEAIAHICRRLDGLPLAIELAAARVRVLAPAQIAARLDDRYRLLTSGSRTAVARHRTLREAMEWSYNLLDEREQLVLRRLSVFAGGFSLESAEGICVCGLVSAGDVLDLVSSLVDKSLVTIEVRGGEARYAFLETVRQYAAERLRQSGEEPAVRDRHAATFVTLAESLEPRLLGGAAHPDVMHRLDDELPNLRAAFEWLVADPARAEGARRLAWALRWYWFARGLLVEGRDRLTRALAAGDGGPDLSRGLALSALGLVCWWQGDFAAVHPPLEESIGILARAGVPRHHVSALIVHGMASAGVGDHATAASRLDEAVQRAQGLQPPALLVYALFQRGLVAFWRRDHATALASLREAERTARGIGHGTAVAHVLSSLANLAYEMGEHETALGHVDEVLATARATGERWAAVQVMHVLVRHAVDAGHPARATRILGVMDAWRQSIGAVVAPVDRSSLEQIRERALGALGRDAFEEELERGRRMGFDEALDYLLESIPAAVTMEHAAARAADAVEPAAQVPPLEIRALGPLEVLRDGRPVAREAWRYARPRELLLYLLAHPAGRTRDQIGLVFWPDASAAHMKNNFHVTLHQVRKALGGTEWIIFGDERYAVNWKAGVRFDAASFEHDVRAVLARPRTDDAATAQLGAALAAYRGDFLEEEAAGEWHFEIRDHLRRIWRDAMMAYGERLFERQEYAAAADVYRRLLAREELHEAAYRQLFRCYARLGDRAGASREYGRLVTLLRSDLEAEPERETVAVYERVRRGEMV